MADERVVGFDEAMGIVLAQAGDWVAGAVEQASLLEARGRFLAGAVKADRDQPPFDRSTRDGYAVRAESFALGTRLRVLGCVRAGELWSGGSVGEMDAVQIMTGAPMPEGADAVAMVEHVVRERETVRAASGRGLKTGENVVPRGSEARLGAEVIPVGVRLGAAEIALAAACGCGSLGVYRRPRVAIVATGDELVELDVVPAAQQIRNSNSYALAAMVEAAGGEAVRLAITPDERGAVRASIARARECELVVLSGGVSMGEYDLVEEMLLEAGAEFFFTGVRMQPGKPVVFGRMPAAGDLAARYFFGLPGNPISTQVTFHCFVEPMLRAMCGGGVSGPEWVLGEMADGVAAKAGLTRVLPARMDDTKVRVVAWQGSGDLAANARANGYVRLEAGVEYKVGDVVKVLVR